MNVTLNFVEFCWLLDVFLRLALLALEKKLRTVPPGHRLFGRAMPRFLRDFLVWGCWTSVVFFFKMMVAGLQFFVFFFWKIQFFFFFFFNDMLNDMLNDVDESLTNRWKFWKWCWYMLIHLFGIFEDHHTSQATLSSFTTPSCVELVPPRCCFPKSL